MHESDWLLERFEASRSRLRAVAYRMLGTYDEADDAVQETWLRLGRADTSGVVNLGGWLTTIVARVCLDKLRARRARREVLLPTRLTNLPAGGDEGDPEQQVLMAETVGSALLVVLELLTPAERVAFALHDVFAISFEEIAPIVGRSPGASRQLASRARRRIQQTAPAADFDLARQHAVVSAFLAASKRGDFEALLTLLDPEVEFRADTAAREAGAPFDDARGARALAAAFLRRAHGARVALVDGLAGWVWAPGGQPLGVFQFSLAEGRIASIRMSADPVRIHEMDVVLLDT